MTAAEFQPHFERALSQFASEQKGEIMSINVRSLLTFQGRNLCREDYDRRTDVRRRALEEAREKREAEQ